MSSPSGSGENASLLSVFSRVSRLRRQSDASSDATSSTTPSSSAVSAIEQGARNDEMHTTVSSLLSSNSSGSIGSSIPSSASSSSSANAPLPASAASRWRRQSMTKALLANAFEQPRSPSPPSPDDATDSPKHNTSAPVRFDRAATFGDFTALATKANARRASDQSTAQPSASNSPSPSTSTLRSFLRRAPSSSSGVVAKGSASLSASASPLPLSSASATTSANLAAPSKSFDCAGLALDVLPIDRIPLDVKRVDATNNSIMSVPVDLCSRPIRHLLIAHNRLTWLPPAFSQLSHQLTHLDISHNLLSSFPVVVLKLDQLVEFSLNGNKVHRLPKKANLVTWPRLRSLSVSHCALTKAPSWICALPSLEHLDISHNEIECLPPALAELEKPIDLRCDNNPLVWPSLASSTPTATNPNDALQSLLRAAAARANDLPQVRIAVLGPRYSGKSSIVQALAPDGVAEPLPDIGGGTGDSGVALSEFEALGRPPSSSKTLRNSPNVAKRKLFGTMPKPSTPPPAGAVAPTTSTVSFGTALKLETAEQAPRCVQMHMRTKNKQRPRLSATLIDFTARQVTDDTYTVFVTSSCVVLLVWDLSRDDVFDVKSQIESLQAFAGACPIVLVGSHSDLPQCSVEHTDRMFRQVLAAVGPSHHIYKCIPVSTVNGENVRELRQLLEELVSNAYDSLASRAIESGAALPARLMSSSSSPGSPLRRSSTAAPSATGSGGGSPGAIRRSSGNAQAPSSAVSIAPLLMAVDGSLRRRIRREMLADVLTAEARSRAVPVITWRELLVLARKLGMRSSATVLDAVRALHSEGRVWHTPLTAIGGVVELLDAEATVLKDKLVERTTTRRSQTVSAGLTRESSQSSSHQLSADGEEWQSGALRRKSSGGSGGSGSGGTRGLRPTLATIDENEESSFLSATDSDEGRRSVAGSVLSTSTSASLDASDNSGCSSSDDSNSDDSSVTESSSDSDEEPLLFARPPLTTAISTSPLRRSLSTSSNAPAVTTASGGTVGGGGGGGGVRPHLTAAQLNEADGLLVLSVQWLMTGLSRLLADDACKDTDVRKPAGVLLVSDAARILNHNEYPASVHPLLFAVMMSRNIAFRLPSVSDGAGLASTPLSKSARHRALQYVDGHYIKPSTMFWIPRLSTVARPDMSLTWPASLPALGVSAQQRMRTPGLRRLRCVVKYNNVPPRCVAQLVSELTVPLTRVWAGGALLTSAEQRILVELRMHQLTIECEGVRDVDALGDTVRTVYELLDNTARTTVEVLLACTSCLVHARSASPHEFALATIERAVLSGATALDCPVCGSVELVVLAPHVTLAHRPDLLMRKSELRLSTKDALAVTADAVVRKARLGDKRVAIKRLQFDPTSSSADAPTLFGASEGGDAASMQTWWRELRCLLSLTPDKLNSGAECVVRPVAFSLAPPMIALPLAPHGDLYNWLRSPAADKLLRWPLRLRMALDLARGLEFLHSLTPPLIHGDLKSPNCLVFATDVAHTCVRITDFGCSTHTPSLLYGSRAADQVANPTWAAPETRAGVLVARGDVYALGIVLWELATRRHPFALDEKPTAFMASLELDILRGRRPPLPSGLPRAFAHAMTECWRPLRFRPNAVGARALVEAAALGCGLNQRSVNAMTLGRSAEQLTASARLKRHRLHETGAVSVAAPVVVQCMLLVPQRDLLWIGARSDGLLIYDVQSGALRHRVPAVGSIDSLALCGDNVWGVGSDSVHVWEAVAFVSRTHSSALHLLEADGSDRAHVFVLETGAIYRQIAHGTRTVELALSGAKITELVKREFRFTVRAADGATRSFRAPSFSVYSGWVAALGDEIMLRSLPPVKSLWQAPVTRNRVGLPLVAICSDVVWFAGIAPSGESQAPSIHQLSWRRDAAELERAKSAVSLVGFGAAANAEGAFVARHNVQFAASGAVAALTSCGGELWIGTSGSRRGSDVYRIRWAGGVASAETLPLSGGDGGVGALAINPAHDNAWACTTTGMIYCWSLSSGAQQRRFSISEYLPSATVAAKAGGGSDSDDYAQRSQAPVLCCFANNTVLYGDRASPTVLTLVNETTVSAASMSASAVGGVTGIASVNDYAVVAATVHSFHWLTA